MKLACVLGSFKTRLEYRLVTGSWDKTVRVWNVQAGECTHTLEGHTSPVRCVAFNGTTIAIGFNDRAVRIWRAPYNTAECERVIKGHTESVNCVWLCTEPNEHIVVSADAGNTVHVHEIRTGDRMCAPIDCNCKLS
jgi:WD40 repeat protein